MDRQGTGVNNYFERVQEQALSQNYLS